MARFKKALNYQLNYWKQISVTNHNFVEGFNNINTGFFVIQAENIESASDNMQVFRMNQFGSVVKEFNNEFSLRLYCLQSLFDFSSEEERLEKIKEESTERYIKKTAEVYQNAYKDISSIQNDMRKKTYVFAVSSASGIQKIKNFVENIKLRLFRAGLNLIDADNEVIQGVFNQIFTLPKEFKGFVIKNHELEIKVNKMHDLHYDDNGKVKSDTWTKIINIRQTADTFIPLEPFWLANLFEINDIFVSFDVDTLEENKRDAFLGSLKTDFVAVKQYKSQIRNERIAITRQLIEDFIYQVASGEQDVKLVTCLIKITAKTKAKMKAKFIEVNNALKRMGMIYGNVSFRQKEALEFLQPFRCGRRKLMVTYQKDLEMCFPSDAIANAYPFIQTSLFQKEGTLIGISQSGSPLVFNLCDRTKAINGNMCVWGTSGSRKSTLNRIMILGNLLNPKNQQTLVIDFENEYTDLARNFQQQIIEFTRNASKESPSINIFQIPQLDLWDDNSQSYLTEATDSTKRNAYVSQVSYIESILRIVLSKENEKLSINEINVLSREIEDTYSKFNIKNTSNFNIVKNNEWPTLDDLFDNLVKESQKLEKKDTYNELEDYKRMIRLIKPFTKYGVYDGVFNKYTNINVEDKNQLVVFNLHGLLDQDTPDEIKTAMLMSVMRYWNNVMLGQRKRFPNEKDPKAKYITFIIDEFHKLVNNKFPQGLELLSSMYAQLRKYYCQIVVTTQSISTFTKAQNEDVKRYLTQILDNSYYKVILGMGERQLEDLNNIILYDTGQLTDGERMYLATSSNMDGGKFVIILGEKERISGRIYSASTNNIPDYLVRVKYENIAEPIQLWQKETKDEIE